MDCDNSNSPKLDDLMKNLKLGDIITIKIGWGKNQHYYNLMIGKLVGGGLGFWDINTHSYVSVEDVNSLYGKSTGWEVFTRNDDTNFKDYVSTKSNGGVALPKPESDYYWTGGADDNPSYVEIFTDVDWYELPGMALNAITGPAQVAALWMVPPPPVTPMNPVSYGPLSTYANALNYFISESYTIKRYPIIHP